MPELQDYLHLTPFRSHYRFQGYSNLPFARMQGWLGKGRDKGSRWKVVSGLSASSRF